MFQKLPDHFSNRILSSQYIKFIYLSGKNQEKALLQKYCSDEYQNIHFCQLHIVMIFRILIVISVKSYEIQMQVIKIHG